ncbi:MAG TPA: hypothetical protein VEZ44_15630 [bacterium]|nr:hypothetical protein [bacterium]
MLASVLARVQRVILAPLGRAPRKLALIGADQGVIQSPNTRALMGAAAADKQGVPSGVLSTGQ